MSIKKLSRLFFIIIMIICQNGCFETESIVKDKYDIPVKVITKYPNTPIYDINDKKTIIDKIDWFQFFYRYNVEEDGLLLIARQLGQDKADGWISKKHVIEWNNREAICLEYIENVVEDQFVSFFSNKYDLMDNKDPIHTEEPFILFDLSKLLGQLPQKIIKKIISIGQVLPESLLRKKLQTILGKEFDNYWDMIISNSTQIANTYSCNAVYTRYLLPMPALSKFETTDNIYYQVSFKFISDTNKSKPYGFSVGWIKIPSTRKYSVKVYMKMKELELRREQLTKLGQALLEKPDEDPLNSDRTYLKRLIGILSGEMIENQKDTSLFEKLMELPKAKKSKEIITLENTKKYVQVKHTLKKIDLLILELQELGQEGGWINYEDTL